MAKRINSRNYDEVIQIHEDDDSEVIILHNLDSVKEMEEREDVLYVEKGESHWIESVFAQSYLILINPVSNHNLLVYRARSKGLPAANFH